MDEGIVLVDAAELAGLGPVSGQDQERGGDL
jgi:hypothetical protein